MQQSSDSSDLTEVVNGRRPSLDSLSNVDGDLDLNQCDLVAGYYQTILPAYCITYIDKHGGKVNGVRISNCVNGGDIDGDH